MNKSKFSADERNRIIERMLFLRKFMPKNYREAIVKSTGLSISTINKSIYESKINLSVLSAMEGLAKPYLPVTEQIFTNQN